MTSTPTPTPRSSPAPLAPLAPVAPVAPLAHLVAALVGTLAAIAGTGCGGDAPTAPGALALYDTSPARDDFFALPWPSDARLAKGADGKRHLDLDRGTAHAFFDPGFAIGAYLQAATDAPLDGFGTQSAIYFRFDAALDPSSLPATPQASVAADAAAFLVDVTPSSPGYGQRAPVRVSFAADAGRYIGADWLALLPEPGFPLRERTTYTAVVTTRARALDGGPVRADPRFSAGAAPAVATLDLAALHLARADVAVATTFTTLDATSEMHALRDAVYAQAPAPTVAALAHVDAPKETAYDQYTATYETPNFQEGAPPYITAGGAIHHGADGKPAVVRTESIRVSLTIPRAPMPPGGFPVVLYAHGTGGDYQSYIADGSAFRAARVLDGQGQEIAHLAMISVDQVLHGPRDPSGGNPDITFFNFNNIVAAAANPKQGATDDFQLVRFVEGFAVDHAPGTGDPIRFDRDRIYFKGHSQGGLTGPLFLAYEPKVKAAVLSGAGGGLILSLLHKTEPNDVARAVGAIVGEPVDAFHPLLTMLQTLLESSDPANYGRTFFREPPAGVPPKSIYQSLGVVDHFTPVPTIEALALAMGVQPVGAMVDPIATVGLAGLHWGTAPVAGNVAGGKATGVLCEYAVPLDSQGRQRYDGHFVVFDDPAAVRQSNAFLGLHASDGTAKLIP